MNWREHIHSDSAVLTGKPVVRGTRLAVNFLLELFASGWTTAQVLESYPQLPPEALRAYRPSWPSAGPSLAAVAMSGSMSSSYSRTSLYYR